MDRGVVPVASVVPSTHHHGSMYNYLSPQLITSRSGSVAVEGLEMKILQYFFDPPMQGDTIQLIELYVK